MLSRLKTVYVNLSFYKEMLKVSKPWKYQQYFKDNLLEIFVFLFKIRHVS